MTFVINRNLVVINNMQFMSASLDGFVENLFEVVFKHLVINCCKF